MVTGMKRIAWREKSREKYYSIVYPEAQEFFKNGEVAEGITPERDTFS
jgi:hypothetical protein